MATEQHYFRERALRAFGEAFGGVLGKRLSSLIFSPETPTLHDLFSIATRMKDAGVLRSLARIQLLPDEPPLFGWRAQFAEKESAAGSSATSDADALVAALAECLERFLWRNDHTVFRNPCVASEKDMTMPHIALERFAGFSDEQRAIHPRLRATIDTPLLWVEATDLLSKRLLHVPAQTASAALHPLGKREPLVRPLITTGLATGPTRTFARYAGVLEIIERDAFMIMWLNQLTCPRLDIGALRRRESDLSTILDRLEKYHLSCDIIHLPTDAPTHITCAVVRDDAANTDAPFIVGLGTHTSLARSASHALREALRIRNNVRSHWRAHLDPATVVPKDIQHHERVLYWLHDRRYEKLAWMTSGPLTAPSESVWERDSREDHLARILEWCKTSGYACVSVDLGSSSKNPTPWYVENVIIPEMQPLYIREQFQCIGGKRLHEVPRLLGFTPRSQFFIEEPHPFA